MFSKFFINRPIFATVLAILMVLAGVVSLEVLPVAQFPDITPPTVQVSAVYPGASAETVAHGRYSDRRAGERRRRHDIYEFYLVVFGCVYAYRYFRGGNRYRYGDGIGTEQGCYCRRKFARGCGNTGNYDT